MMPKNQHRISQVRQVHIEDFHPCLKASWPSKKDIRRADISYIVWRIMYVARKELHLQPKPRVPQSGASPLKVHPIGTRRSVLTNQDPEVNVLA
jgi:hypothetical protein